MIEKILKKIPAELTGDLVRRHEPCRMCGAKEGILLARVDYWDIKQSDIVRCPECFLMQLDTMLSPDDTAKGCLAYYIEETLRVSHKEQERNLIRNFRRGVVFAYSLKKKKIIPCEILELGPGSGYFAAGIKFVFPDAAITVLDINLEILELNKKTFNYKIIKAIPEENINELHNSFDLVIARDILEHVIDIADVIKNINQYLKPGGYFHFITPNGHEDVWGHYLTWNKKQKRSDLLINHVNYFDGKGLLLFLKKNNFKPVEYYTYKIKTTVKGKGWKIKHKLMAPVSRKLSADHFVENKIKELKEYTFDKNKILNKWFINKNAKGITKLISSFHHFNIFRLPPQYNVGHEIYGLFRKLK